VRSATLRAGLHPAVRKPRTLGDPGLRRKEGILFASFHSFASLTPDWSPGLKRAFFHREPYCRHECMLHPVWPHNLELRTAFGSLLAWLQSEQMVKLEIRSRAKK